MLAIECCRIVFIFSSLPVALLAQIISCPAGKNYPAYCPRDGDTAEQTECCINAVNQPSCCKATAVGRKVTKCPEEYSIPHCPGVEDPDDLKYCCRFTNNEKPTDRCCTSSWIMTDPEEVIYKDKTVKYWWNGVVVLSVLFFALLVSLIVILTLYVKLRRAQSEEN